MPAVFLGIPAASDKVYSQCLLHHLSLRFRPTPNLRSLAPIMHLIAKIYVCTAVCLVSLAAPLPLYPEALPKRDLNQSAELEPSLADSTTISPTSEVSQSSIESSLTSVSTDISGSSSQQVQPTSLVSQHDFTTPATSAISSNIPESHSEQVQPTQNLASTTAAEVSLIHSTESLLHLPQPFQSGSSDSFATISLSTSVQPTQSETAADASPTSSAPESGPGTFNGGGIVAQDRWGGSFWLGGCVVC
ncbi:hypothetical protein FB451DRAFT_1564962 [Mycena latifolia]|nr:hypothetical protein FB451DRAFT_1564962 [Mycena latifolia]